MWYYMELMYTNCVLNLYKLYKLYRTILNILLKRGSKTFAWYKWDLEKAQIIHFHLVKKNVGPE